MSSIDATIPSPGALLDPEEQNERFRALAVVSGLLLMGSFLNVFYYITDVAGGTLRLAVVVLLSLVAATKLADRIDERTAGLVGLGLFVLGGGVYLLTVPQVLSVLFEIDFFVAVLSYTTGISVLQFLRVDVWAVALVPAPTFLSWYFLLRRRYAATAVVAGITLGFFAFTGDAASSGPVTLLAGVIGVLGLSAFGTLERVDGDWDQVERVGIVVVLSVIAARLFSIVPRGNRGGNLAAGLGQPTLEASLLNADESVEILGSISLSPEVRFTIEASEGAYWHAGIYNRYTGDSWVRTGTNDPYDSPLDPPPGRSGTVEQSVEVETELFSMPAAWKPVRLVDEPDSGVRVTEHGGFVPQGTLSEGDAYVVESEIPARSPESLREAGTDYPDSVTGRYLEVPNSLPDRVVDHARAITRGAETPYDQAIAIERWLTANKSYSLKVNKPDGDIVDGFVFRMQSGYCVYFASAMAVLLRTLDVPTRFVVGYTTGQQVSENRWVVRGLDSHAWVEVYFPDIGWIPFDPTPSNARISRQRGRIQVARRRNESNVDVAASRPGAGTPTPTATSTPPFTGVNFTRVQQGGQQQSPSGPDIPERIQQTLGGPGPAPAENPVPNGTVSTSTATEAGRSIAEFIAKRDRISVLAGVAGLAIGAHHFRLFDRVSEEMWLRYQRRTDSPTEDVERAFARLERVLSRQYRERESGETPRQYVHALEREGADLGERVERVAEIRERTRYAGEASREEADEAISLVDEIVRDS